MSIRFIKKPANMRKTRAGTKNLPPNPRLKYKTRKAARPMRRAAPVNHVQQVKNNIAGTFLNKIKNTFFSTKEKRQGIIVASALVIAAVFLFAWGMTREISVPVSEIIPVSEAMPTPESAATVAKITSAFSRLDNTFVLSGLEQFSEADIKSGLTLSPNVGFEIEKLDNGNVRVIPAEAKNIAYNGSFKYTAENGGTKTVMFEVNQPALTVSLQGPWINEYQSIVLAFSEQVDIYSLEKNLQISPKVNFELGHDLNEVRIMPTDGWLYSDRYTITIGKDYKSANGKQFDTEETLNVSIIDSQYAKRINPYIEFKTAGSFMLNPGDDMTMSFFANNLKQNIPVVINTYRIPSVERYRNQGHIYLDYDVSLDSLERLDSNVYLIQNTPDADGKGLSYYEYQYDAGNMFVVPNPGEGAYILEATYTDPLTKKETNVRAGYLVTPISAYMQTSERETAVWLNSSTQNAPLSGYEVTFEGMDEPAGKTNENGLLVVSNDKLPKNEEYWSSNIPFSIAGPDGELVYYDNAKNMYVSQANREHYYSYLFLDRTLYRPEDTVCFWGYVKPFRYNQTEMPKTAFVRFDPDGLDLTAEVEIDESGMFSGEIALERIKSTQYAVSAELRFPAVDEDINNEDNVRLLETEYVSVKEFQKPTFVLSSTIDKDYYAGDDMVTVTAKAAFYDGTPLPDYPLEIGYYDTRTYAWVDLPGIRTDSMGNATFSFPAVGGGISLYSDYYLNSNRYKVQIANDGEQVTHVSSYKYFPSDILTETSFEVKDGNVSMTVRAYKFDVDSPALKDYMERAKTDIRYWRWYSSDELIKVAKGEPIDVELNLDLRWSYTDQNDIWHRNSNRYEDGRYVRYKNSYSLDLEQQFEILDDWETKLKRISVETKDGVAVVDGLVHMREGNVIDFSEPVYVSAALSYKDKKNNEYIKYSYYTNTNDYSYWEREYDEEDQVVEGYSFAITDVTTGQDITPKSRYYGSISVSAEHVLKFDLLLDGKPVETNGRIFYSVLQDGIYDHNVVRQNSFSMPYKIGYGRSVNLAAVYFDGEKTRYIKQLDLYATNESLAVNIEVTPDKTVYRPGETVNLAVKATDYLGRGVAGNLCVSVVDEAIFALAEQEVDALYGIFNTTYSFNNSVSQYCTTYRNANEPVGGFDGGKGGDGGVEFYDSYRSNFKDTALFLPTRTDASGNSRISFTLPDNTTSWRITAVEIGGDLRAGQLKTNILSSLPFFVKPVMTSKYIEGDDISMLVQGHGTLLKTGDDISYSVTVKGDGVDITLTGEGKTSVPLEFNFGKLPIGSYTVISKAQYSGYSDTVELPLDILKSNLELVVNKPVDPQKKLDISAVRYPVTLTFYDKANEAFFASVNSLLGHYCMQANQRMSRFVAKRVVRDTIVGGTAPSYIAQGNDNASDMQNDDGGIAFYPGQGSDPLVTTYVLLVAKDQFNLPLMASYYRNVLSTETDVKTRAACWLGLAAIGNARTDEILAELEKTNITTDAQAYLVAALAYLDETEMATKLYNQHLSPLVAGINPDVRKDENYELNAAAIWVAASRLHHPDADALSLYFGGTHWRYRTLFECMIYVTNYNRQVNLVDFSYAVKNEKKQINLGLSGMGTLVLSKSELESLELINPPESLKATAYYVGEPSEFGLEQSDNMSISKTIDTVDNTTYEVTLKISLKKDAPTGYYDISDWVPSNTRLYSYDSNYGTVYFDTENEGQKLYISFYNKAQTEREIVYKYRVRQTFTGTAVLDTTYMIHGDSGENCHTQKSEFTPSAQAGRAPAITAAR